MERWIIDSSVILAAHLGDKKFRKVVSRVIEDCMNGTIYPLAPIPQMYEIIQGLQEIVYKNKLDNHLIEDAIADTFDLDIEYRSVYLYYEPMLRFCRQFHCSMYTASYLVLAEQERANFLTADKKLYKTLHPKLEWVIWLGDYPKIKKKS
jgi:predicted nucleic acid-binding protein